VGSKHVFYASECGARLDSDVIAGGGTDDTAALQAVLDKAPALGSLHLVVDGAALVRGLDVHSHTTITCLNASCGFFLAPQSNRAVLRNAHPDPEHRRDVNITLEGGTYNQDARNQVHRHVMTPRAYRSRRGTDWHVVSGLEFFGVENLVIRGITIRNQRTFALFLTNWYRVTLENIVIDCPDDFWYQAYRRKFETGAGELPGGNQDGIHVQGPGQFLTMRSIQGNSWDDFIALNADDYLAAPGASGGDITDVLIDGVFLNNALQGIRLMSSQARMDRIRIRNVTGTYRWFGFIVDAFCDPLFDGDTLGTVAGNFGTVLLEGIDLRQTEGSSFDKPWPPFLFKIGGRHESLVLRDIVINEPAFPGSPIRFDADWNPADIRSLLVDGLRVVASNAAAAEAPYLAMGGTVDLLAIRNVEIARSAAMPRAGCVLELGKGTRMALVTLSGITANRLRALVSVAEGSVGTLHLANVLATELAEAVVSVGDAAIGTLRAEGVREPILSMRGGGKVAADA